MKRDCARCDEERQQLYGCKEETPYPDYWFYFPEEYGFKPLKRCPIAILDRRAVQAWESWKHYQDGYLPGAGGILDQPRTYREALQVIANVVRLHKEEIERRENAATERGSPPTNLCPSS